MIFTHHQEDKYSFCRHTNDIPYMTYLTPLAQYSLLIFNPKAAFIPPCHGSLNCFRQSFQVLEHFR